MTVRHFRPGTDDTRWVLPELVQQDMYRAAALAEALAAVDGAVLDCGAHIGVFSILLAGHGARHWIQAFEPEPENYALLVKNAAPYPNITAVQEAVGTRDEERVLYDGGDTGRWSFVPRQPGGGIRTPVLDLYRHIRSLGRVALLKLDLEGYEAEVLNQMPPDVLERVHLLVTEEHHLPIDYDRLTAAGFQCWFHALGDPKHRVYRKAGPAGK
jgi:FkbM family methyltransferase